MTKTITNQLDILDFWDIWDKIMKHKFLFIQSILFSSNSNFIKFNFYDLAMLRIPTK